MHLKLVFFVISSCPKVSFIPAMYPTVKCLFSFYIYKKRIIFLIPFQKWVNPFIHKLIKMPGKRWSVAQSGRRKGCTVQSSALFPHGATSPWVVVHIMCTMWNLDICHVYTVKLFHSCFQLHLQDRPQTNKVFHSRLVLTVHWPLQRGIIGRKARAHTHTQTQTEGVGPNYSSPRDLRGK